MKKNLIYFDIAATTPLSKNVLNNINYIYEQYWGNVSSTYKYGIACSEKLEKIRTNIANLFNTMPEDIIFTSGSTESRSIVFNKINEKYSNKNITISSVEHQATIISANILRNKGWDINKWAVDNKGLIDPYEFDKYVNKDTKLVSIIWGQSEIGTIQPIQEIGKRCKQKGILFHVDGTQIISNGLFNWNKLNCNLMSLSAHKFGGPKGIGILLTKKNSRTILKNEDISFSQEYSIRAGTQPLALISGTCQAIRNIKGNIIINDNKITFENCSTIKLRNYLINKYKKNNKIEITGSISNRLPNHLSFIVLNKDNNPIEAYKIVNFMSENNIAISSGSACSSHSKKPSNTLKNMGYDQNKQSCNIRISFSDKNTLEELDIFYKLILKCIEIF